MFEFMDGVVDAMKETGKVAVDGVVYCLICVAKLALIITAPVWALPYTMPTAAETLTAAINSWVKSIKPVLATFCENVAAAFSNVAAGLRGRKRGGRK